MLWLSLNRFQWNRILLISNYIMVGIHTVLRTIRKKIWYIHLIVGEKNILQNIQQFMINYKSHFELKSCFTNYRWTIILFLLYTERRALFSQYCSVSCTHYHLSNYPGNRIFKGRNMNKCITFWPGNCQLATGHRVLCLTRARAMCLLVE